MSEAARLDPAADRAERVLADQALLRPLGARLLAVEPGYVEIEAEIAGEAAASAGALALLAEAAARLAALTSLADPANGASAASVETTALSVHLHTVASDAPTAKLVARGEAVRPATADRPKASCQADVFRVSASGGESLAASALASLRIEI